MFLRSFRGKIFLAMSGLLLVIAGTVLPVTQQDVSHTIETGERHAVQNVLQLVLRHIEGRWKELLDEKIDNVRNGRKLLMELGSTIQSVLASYESDVQRGLLSPALARQQALNWLSSLPLGGQRYAFIYDAQHQILASSTTLTAHQNLAAALDIKGRPLAQALYDESRYSGHGFALYRWPSTASDASPPPTHYAYFSRFSPWDWTLAVADIAQGIIHQVQNQTRLMETSLQEALSPLVLAQSGFLFIMDDDGRFIVPPPAAQKPLLQARDPLSDRTLADILQTHSARQEVTVTLEDQPDWNIQSLYYKPLRWTIAAAVPQSDFTAPARRLTERQALIFTGALLFALALGWLMAMRIAKPLNTLTDYTLQLSDQDLTQAPAPPASITRLPERYKDEVGRLSASFLLMQTRLNNNIQRLLQETSARERFESELTIARDIQMGLLPKPLPPESRRYIDLCAAIQPAKEVGGDLYDYFLLPDGRLCFVIGDVSDKGVPAALFMAVIRTLIRATAEDETDPAAILGRINNRLADNNPNMMFVTLLLGVINLPTGELIWANAGHPAPILVGADTRLQVLSGRSGPACGVQPNLTYCCFNYQLEQGQTLFGYTDGITDAANRQEQQYGEPRMMAQLSSPVSNAHALVQKLLADVQQFTDGASPFDDITLIAVRRPYA